MGQPRVFTPYYKERKILINTADINLPFKKEVVKVKNQRTISVEGRSCMVLIAKEDKKADVRKKV